jgi:hypothetical protein
LLCPRREWSPRQRCDMDVSPAGVEVRARRDQSNRTVERHSHYHFSWRALSCPRREWSPRERCDMDLSPAGVEARARRDQSNRTVERLWRYHFSWRASSCPRRESNPHLRFRKPSFYPLNYGDKWNCDFRFANADCPEASDSARSSPDRARHDGRDGALRRPAEWGMAESRDVRGRRSAASLPRRQSAVAAAMTNAEAYIRPRLSELFSAFLNGGQIRQGTRVVLRDGLEPDRFAETDAGAARHAR